MAYFEHINQKPRRKPGGDIVKAEAYIFISLTVVETAPVIMALLVEYSCDYAEMKRNSFSFSINILSVPYPTHEPYPTRLFIRWLVIWSLLSLSEGIPERNIGERNDLCLLPELPDEVC